MTRIKRFLIGLGQTGRVIVVSTFALFVAAGIAQAATTISTNISTGGTLSVTGVSTFVNSSTTQSATIGGPLWVGGHATTTAAGALTLDSTLNVTGVSTFVNSSTTQSATIGGPLWVGGNATTTAAGALTLRGPLTVTNPAATSTATVGCVVTTATSSATSIRLLFNTQATTTSINGNTVQGVVLWGYGSDCAN